MFKNAGHARQLKFITKFLLEPLIAVSSHAHYFLPSFLPCFLHLSSAPSVIRNVWSMCIRVHLYIGAACNFIQL